MYLCHQFFPSWPRVKSNSFKHNQLVNLIFRGRKKKWVASNMNWSDKEGKGTVGIRRSKAGEGEADGPNWNKHLLPLLRCYCSGYGSLVTQRMGHRIFLYLFYWLITFIEQFSRWWVYLLMSFSGFQQSLWIYLLFNSFQNYYECMYLT